MRQTDPYETLGVSRAADDERIRSAFRVAAKRAHPDAGGNPEKFRQLRDAYESISTAERRAAFAAAEAVNDARQSESATQQTYAGTAPRSGQGDSGAPDGARAWWEDLRASPGPTQSSRFGGGNASPIRDTDAKGSTRFEEEDVARRAAQAAEPSYRPPNLSIGLAGIGAGGVLGAYLGDVARAVGPLTPLVFGVLGLTTTLFLWVRQRLTRVGVAPTAGVRWWFIPVAEYILSTVVHSAAVMSLVLAAFAAAVVWRWRAKRAKHLPAAQSKRDETTRDDH